MSSCFELALSTVGSDLLDDVVSPTLIGCVSTVLRCLVLFLCRSFCYASVRALFVAICV